MPAIASRCSNTSSHEQEAPTIVDRFLATPAPWVVAYEPNSLDSSRSDLRIIDGRPESVDHPQGPVTIATFNVAAFAPWTEEARANAQLAASAPAMKEALVMCQTWFHRFSPTAPCIDGKERIHPMLEMIEKTLARTKVNEP